MISAVIIVGGRGKRLGQATLNLPKPLVDINGKPFIHYLISQLYQCGIRKVTFLAGYLAEECTIISELLMDDFDGLSIQIHESSPSLNTGERLVEALEELDDRFLFLYGDNYAPFDLQNYLENADEQMSSMVVYKNEDNYSNSNIILDSENNVLSYGKHKNLENDPSYVDVGYFILNKSQISEIEIKPNAHFGNDILSKLVVDGRIQSVQYLPFQDPILA